MFFSLPLFLPLSLSCCRLQQSPTVIRAASRWVADSFLWRWEFSPPPHSLPTSLPPPLLVLTFSYSWPKELTVCCVTEVCVGGGAQRVLKKRQSGQQSNVLHSHTRVLTPGPSKTSNCTRSEKCSPSFFLFFTSCFSVNVFLLNNLSSDSSHPPPSLPSSPPGVVLVLGKWEPDVAYCAGVSDGGRERREGWWVFWGAQGALGEVSLLGWRAKDGD